MKLIHHHVTQHTLHLQRSRWYILAILAILAFGVLSVCLLALLPLRGAGASQQHPGISYGLINTFLAASLLSFLGLLLALIALNRQRDRIFSLEKSVQDDKNLVQIIFDEAPIGICVMRGYQHTPMMNKEYLAITGRTGESLANTDWNQITYPPDLEADLAQFSRLEKGEISSYSIEKRLVRPDGSLVWVAMSICSISGAGVEGADHICMLQDITARKESEASHRESERSKSVFLNQLPGLAYRCKYDPEWTMEFLSSGCLELTGYNPEELTGNRDISFTEIILPEYRMPIWDEWKRVLAAKTNFTYEYEIRTKDGRHKWVLEHGQGIYSSNGNVKALEGIMIDITEKKVEEQEKLFLLDHDPLTNLFSRTYFQTALSALTTNNNLPLSLIIANVNGMRLINDAFGHHAGDSLLVDVASLLSHFCQADDVLARIGDDEFCLLMPKTDSANLDRRVNAIKEAIGAHNAHYAASGRAAASGIKQYGSISLALGYATTTSLDFDLMKAASEMMHESKTLERNSNSNNVLQSILVTLEERSPDTERHGIRLAAMTKRVGEHIGLGEQALNDLRLFSVLHDIGKIAIDSQILNKPGPLTAEEWAIMRTHSEVGYRIAMSSPDFRKVAPFILSHHERWDGRGYPQGIKNETIPLPSRILAIADSYDAMTEQRPYRKPLSHNAALEEIRKCAGTQFDPTLVDAFLECANDLP